MELETILQRLDALEKHDGEFVEAIKDLREAAIVTAAIQRRQAEAIKDHADWLTSQDQSMIRHQQRMEYVDQRLAEITDKLDGLIGYLDNLPRGSQEPPTP